MANVPKTWTLEDYPDPATHLYYNEVKQRRLEANPDKDPDMTDILSDLQHKARDNARTPMQWSTATNAGFSDSPNTAAKPWMRVNPDYVKYNVETERSDPNSVLSYWKKAIQFRKANLACVCLRYLRRFVKTDEVRSADVRYISTIGTRKRAALHLYQESCLSDPPGRSQFYKARAVLADTSRMRQGI